MKIFIDDLLKEAGFLFVKYGYAGCKLDMIADKVGLKKTSLFAHFKSKDDLYDKAINTEILNMQNPDNKYKIHVGSLLDFINDYIEGIKNVTEKGKIAGVTSGEYFSFMQDVAKRKPDISEKIRIDFENKEIELWTNQIRAAQLTGEVKKEIDPQKESTIFRYSYIGYCYCRAMQGGITIEETKDFLMDFYNKIKDDQKEEEKDEKKEEQLKIKENDGSTEYKGWDAIIR